MASNSSKRPFPQDEDESDGSLPPRRPKRSRLWPLCYEQLTSLWSIQSFTLQLEPFLREVVQDEVQKVVGNCFHPSPRFSINQAHGAARFCLQFLDRLPRTLFAGRGIKSVDKAAIRVALKDAILDKIVTSEPWASLRIKIVALSGAFDSDARTSWSNDEFERHVVHEREGRRPLLTGELNIRLCNGVGHIADATFTDNSRWTRTGKFRLAAVVSDSRLIGERIQEGISEAVKVKDARVESSQKDAPPSLEDKVFCLKNIQKAGPFHQRLTSARVDTVKDFLRSYIIDNRKLLNLLKMPNTLWEATVRHAFQCNRGNKSYYYSVPEKGIVLLFNSIFEPTGIQVDGIYHPLNALSASLQGLVNYYKKLAYNNVKDIHELHDMSLESLKAMDVVSVPGPVLTDPHNCNHPSVVPDSSSGHLDVDHRSYAPHNAVTCNASHTGLDPLPRYSSLQTEGSFSRSSDRCASLSIPGLSSSQAAIRVQTALHASKQVDSASFVGNKIDANVADEKKLVDDMIAELYYHFPGETSNGASPQSPHKWVRLSVAFRFVSVIKQPARRI